MSHPTKKPYLHPGLPVADFTVNHFESNFNGKHAYFVLSLSAFFGELCIP
jgi:hypothetical protein